MAPVVALGFGLISTAGAATHPGSKTGRGGTHHATTGANAHAQAVQSLRQAHALLVKADHDYQGHRAKAAHHVSQAIHALTGQPHHGAGAGGAGKGNAAGNANRLPQAESDAHLKQARQLLSTASGKLNGHTAGQHVTSAITELDTALKIK
jgi:hypothetical protein